MDDVPPKPLENSCDATEAHNPEGVKGDSFGKTTRLQNISEAASPANEASLRDVLARHEIRLPAAKIRRLEEYCALLWEWNDKLNLTRHTDYEKFVTRDLVDAMRLADLLHPKEFVLDVGTGGGTPGVLLAILRPDLRVDLCDSTGKKAVAVGNIVERLKMDTPVWHAKAQDVLKVHRFTSLVIRAVARMPKLLDWFAPHWTSFDRLLLIKGPNWVGERGESRHFNKLSKLALRKLDSYPIPNSENESVILQICQQGKFDTLDKAIAERIAAGAEIAVANKSAAKTAGKKGKRSK